MRLTYGLPLCVLLLALSCTAQDDRFKKKKTYVVMAEPNEPKDAYDFESVGVSLNDLLPPPLNTTLPPPIELSPGAEFVPERLYPENDEKGAEIYEQALKYFRRGYGYGEDEKKAAYLDIADAAQLGHPDAKKLMGFAHLFGDRARFAPDEAKKIFTELAANGSADALLGLGFMYSVGLGVQRNRAKAHAHLSFAALGGSTLAKMAMGYRYLFGVGVPRHCETALHYYKNASFEVAKKIQFFTGYAEHRVHLNDDRVRWRKKGEMTPILDQNQLDYIRFEANSGDEGKEFQYMLGRLYLVGHRGVQQDFNEAKKYLSMAADGGHLKAGVELGKMYLEGTHVTPANNVTAFNLFLKAAEKKVPVGYTCLGVMYFYGDGVRKDYQKAAKLFRMAADQGDGEGQIFLGTAYLRGMGVKRNLKKAFQYYEMATKNGQHLALNNLGVMQEAGAGVEKSCEVAAELFKHMAERGHWAEKLTEAFLAFKIGRADEAALKYLFLAELGYEPAQTNFAYLLDEGKISKSLFPGSQNETYSRALLQWRRAANQDQVFACIKVGDYYYYGQGVAVNYERAASYYEEGAHRYHLPQSMFNMGYMYEHGIGVPQDFHIAKRYYDSAAEVSGEAYAPTQMALMSLRGRVYFNGSNEWPMVKFLDSNFGASWEIGLTVILASLLIIAVAALVKKVLEQRRDF